MSGEIQQNGETVMNTDHYGTLINLTERLQENLNIEATFVQIKCGYSHALILDNEGRVYSFGAGANG